MRKKNHLTVAITVGGHLTLRLRPRLALLTAGFTGIVLTCIKYGDLLIRLIT